MALLGVLGPDVSKKIIDQKILCGFRSLAVCHSTLALVSFNELSLTPLGPCLP
jgi:hypothetical protein